MQKQIGKKIETPASTLVLLLVSVFSITVFSISLLTSAALALTEGELEEVMQIDQENLQRVWHPFTYKKPATVQIQFLALPDGSYQSVSVYQTSGDPHLDMTAKLAFDKGTPLRGFVGEPLQLIAGYYVDDKGGEVTVHQKGKLNSGTLADRKIAVKHKYHLNAIAIMKKRIADGEKVLGKDSPKLSESLNFLANEYREIADYPAAQATFQRALSIREKANGPQSREVAQTICDLAQLDEAQGAPDKARDKYRQVIAMEKLPPGPELCKALEYYAKLLFKEGKQAAAEALYQRIRDIKSGKLTSNDPPIKLDP